MRSHPYTPPPPLPPIFDELANMLPAPKPAHQNHSRDDSDIPLDTLDHDTSRLIPAKRRTHRVWVQGQLAAVRSVTNTISKVKTQSRWDRGVSGTRRRSLGDAGEIDEHDEKETALRAKQMRGYGIGGFGNIRRPTDVIHGPDLPNPLSPRLSGSPTQQSSSTEDLPSKQKRGLRDFFRGSPADTKGKARAT